MASLPRWRDVRRDSTRYGVGIVVAGLILLLVLRLWASPIARAVRGRTQNGLFEFLLIPTFLAVVGVGILLFLWEPDVPNHDVE